MIGSSRNTGARKARAQATPAVAPLTRAIRHSIAFSATMLALSVPATVLASEACPAGARIACMAAAANAGTFAPPLDLTRVQGEQPMSVYAAMPYVATLANDIGLEATGYDSASLENAGPIEANASDAGDAQAYGAVSSSPHFSDLTNTADGSIVANADAHDGTAIAVGAYGIGGDVTTVTNDGTIAAHATSVYGDAQAYAAVANGNFTGIGLLVNGGDLHADATASNGGDADAAGAFVIGNVASVFNDASSTATATANGGGTATARGARAYGMYSAVSNYGDLTAIANATDGTAKSRGAEAYGYNGATGYNAGTIVATANAAGGVADSVGAYTLGVIFGAYTDNKGAITAHADGEQATAMGVVNASTYIGNAITTNDGSITAVADGGIAAYGEREAVAFGVYNFAFVYDSIVENNGSISASSSATADIAIGDGFLTANAIGALPMNAYGYGLTSVLNGGDIHADADASLGYASAWGAAVQVAAMYAAASIDNTGSIEAYAHVGVGSSMAIGAYGVTVAGTTDVVNHGDIVASSRAERGVVNMAVDYAYATGISATSVAYGAGSASVANYGTIQAHASADGGITGARGIQAYGMETSVYNAEGARIIATGETDLFGGGFASGIEAAGALQVDVVNHGDITVYGHSHGYQEGIYTFYSATRAMGIYASANLQGNVSVENTGTIDAISIAEDSITFFNGGAGATGIDAYAKYDATIVTSGDVTAIAQSDLGITGAYGVVAHGKYTSNIVNAAGTTIYASASVGSLASDAYGGRAVAFGTHIIGADYGVLQNDGRIVAHATATPDGGANENRGLAMAIGSSIGMYSHVGTATLTNAGDIEAVSSADFGYATTYGTYVQGSDAADTVNRGAIHAIATADDGNAFVVGSHTLSVHTDAYGAIDGGAATLDNSGTISAFGRALRGTSYAYGAAVVGGSSVHLANAGTISAAAYGGDATATGVVLISNTTNILDNTGTIAAFGDGERIAIASSTDAIARLSNAGTVIGAIHTGELDDSFDNAAGARWIAVGESTFGAGDDHVTNHGTLFMQDAAIRLGAYTGGNTFDNFGTIAVSGAANIIDMDNPFAVFNNGTITFVDGATDDGLTIVGDFAGQGRIALDVSGAHHTADQVRVDGSVIAPTAQTIDVNLLDLPDAANFALPLLTARDALSGAFTLGDVHYAPNGFLAMRFALSQTDKEVLLGMEVTGLSGAGSLATGIAPGVQSLVDAQVGTWRQRMGFVPAPGKTGLSPWVRAFTNSGAIDPTHSANFGPGGTFDFHQSNHGWEVGLDARPTERVAVGMLAAKSDGTQRIDGAGEDRFDGDTFGLYATLMGANGWYLDVSQRWSGIDARLRSSEGMHTTSASASSFNAETGFTAWSTQGGLHLVPQLQYTHTRVSDIAPMQTGASTFTSDGGDSSRARLGLAVDQSFQGGGFTWTPYGSLNVVREFDGEYQHAINDALVATTSTEGTSAMVELGLGARSGAWSFSGGVQWMDGGAVDSVAGGQLMVRYSW